MSCLRIVIFLLLGWLSGSSPLSASDDLTLIDHHGKTFSFADQQGKIVLMFFGYTHCPAICPDSLGKMALTLKALDNYREQIRALFVTVDPERDTPELLADYVGYFSPQLTGLTGSPEQLRRVADAFHIQYKLHKQSSDDQSYVVDHTASLIVLNRQGELTTTIPFGLPAEHIVEVVRGLLENTTEPPPATTPSPGTFIDLQGDSRQLEEYQGENVLVNVWASWCPPCRAELPSLNRAQQPLQAAGIRLLAVNMGEEKAAVQAFLKDYPIEFPLWLDPQGNSLKQWGIKGMPATILFNRAGEAILTISGEQPWDSAEMLARLQAALASTAE